MSIKIGLIKSSPTAIPCALDTVCPQRGYAVDATMLVCRALGLNCTLEWFATTEYGDINENGIGTGLVGAIQRGEYDTALPLFTPTYSRSKGLDFSRAFFFDDIVMVTRTPNSADAGLNLNVVFAFQWQVWCCLCIILLLSSVYLTVAAMKWYPSLHSDSSSLSEDTFLVFSDIIRGLVTAKYNENLFELESFRVVAIIWCAATLVLTSAYTGGMYSQQVVISDSEVPFTDTDTFLQCLERDECRLITHSVSVSYLQHFVAPGTEFSDRIQKALKKHPMEVFNNSAAVIDRIQQERNRYLVWFRTKFGILYSTKGNSLCNFYIVDAHYQEAATFPVKKNSPLLPLLNRAADISKESGFDYRLQSSYFVPSRCNRDAGRNLDGQNLYAERTCFSLFLIGMVIACASLVFEIFCAGRRHSSNGDTNTV